MQMTRVTFRDWFVWVSYKPVYSKILLFLIKSQQREERWEKYFFVKIIDKKLSITVAYLMFRNV
jgi:hypothetical protein